MSTALRPIFWLIVASTLHLAAQTPCKQLIPACRDAYMENFSWDGRYWRAELYGGETSEIYYTFFRGIRYRLIPCGSSSTKNTPHIRIYNANRTLLLDTRQQGDRAYWDLELSTTQLLLIELYYPNGDGCAALLIGHRAPMEASTR
ncbi:MAG: hypothetical protein NZZ60_07360 [Bacteroidia bacterium]|nr:hypothetical protein [Bacteroidia bacterium]MCX7651898.1 hypothetical protein [Bacteroidia bacterium]MDW8416049.1 hypothetical protein [Bacteroidia bacterium]